MKVFSFVTLIALILVLVVIGPYFSILALNTLFGVGIQFNFGTWLAMAWTHMVLAGIKVSKKG